MNAKTPRRQEEKRGNERRDAETRRKKVEPRMTRMDADQKAEPMSGLSCSF
jgi:hypothetical protein